MTGNEEITLEKLEEWCKEYDVENGRYPETELQGLDVFEFLRWKITGEWKELTAKYDYIDYKIKNLIYKEWQFGD